jgi:hypothetical protein
VGLEIMGGGGVENFCGVGSSANNENLLKVLISFLLIQEKEEKKLFTKKFLNILTKCF